MKSRNKFANKPTGNDEYQQVIAEASSPNSGHLIQEMNMKIASQTADKPEGDVAPQQVIAEVAEFHNERVHMEEEIEAKTKSAIKPEGNDEYEQMIAENSVFTTKGMIEEASYFISQRRGFAPGKELSDWYQAEAEVEARQVSDSKLCMVNIGNPGH